MDAFRCDKSGIDLKGERPRQEPGLLGANGELLRAQSAPSSRWHGL
jgi:hypothetical protein